MNPDVQLFYLLNSLAGQSRILDAGIVFFSAYLAYILIALLFVLVYFSDYPLRRKLELLAVAIGSGIIARLGVAELIRYFYHHPRPYFALADVHPLFAETSWSFPSGHAMFFFALSTAVYLYNKRWGVGFLIATTLMTVSRVIAGVHYPSDIVAGAILGSVTAYIIFRIVRARTAENTN